MRASTDAWNTALAFTLAVFNFLSVNSYPILRPESFALWLLVLLPFVLAALLAGRPVPVWLFYAGLILLMTDAASGLVQNLKGWGGWPAVLAATGIVFFAVRLVRRNIRAIFMTGATAGLAAAVLLNFAVPTRLFISHESPNPRAASGEGNIYFFILDEHIGLVSLPEGKELESLYRSEGFAVYPRAYSNYDTTMDSIPSYLNARIFQERRSALRGKTLKTNRLFEQWSAEGRRIHVYQSTHLDLAHPENTAIEKAFTYRESSMGYIRDFPIAWHAKLRALFNNFIEDSHSLTVKKIRRFLQPDRPIRGSATNGALAFGRVLEEIQNDSLRCRAGGVFFAHFLAPHSSYFYDTDCAYLDPSRWESSHYDELDAEGTLNREEDRTRRYVLYRNQIRCLHRQLAGFLDFLRREELYEASTIFITSDHGSRIYRVGMNSKNLDRLTSEDFKDGFSAFLALKKAGVKANGENVSEATPVARVIKNTFDVPVDFPEAAFHTIYVQTDNFKGSMNLEPSFMNTIDYQ